MRPDDHSAPQPARPTPEAQSGLSGVDPGWAWAPYEPSPAIPWGVAPAAHLLRRAGFGATWQELEAARTRGPQATIDDLLREPQSYAGFAREFEVQESAAARSGDGTAFVTWWLRRLHQSPWPLLEKLTLFWHGYFAVRAPAGELRLMQEHVQLLRKHAFATFPALIGAVAADPQMYTALGGDQNRRSRPNLPFARPWLEDFTIGAEGATASALTNLARAWTGWFVYGGKLRFIEREHDPESKSLLGHEGNFGRDDAIRLLAEDPATARNLAQRLFRAFVSESASAPAALLAPIAERIARQEPMVDVLGTILRSNLFFSGHAFGQRIKSPVELTVGLVRSLEGGMPTSRVAGELANLGQRLDAPPTMRGWAGGTDWLNSITLAARLKLCLEIVRGPGQYSVGLDPAKVAARHGFNSPDTQARFLLDLLVAGPLPESAIRSLNEAGATSPRPLRSLLETIVARPEFQLQ